MHELRVDFRVQLGLCGPDIRVRPFLSSCKRERGASHYVVEVKRKDSQRKVSGGRLLDGYKKVGTTFLPPFVHRIGNLEYISWFRQVMPELIWWDVIAERGSHRFAAGVAEAIAEHFKLQDSTESWWAFTSDYVRLDDKGERALKQHLRKADILSTLSDCLVEFLNLYPECPINRIIEPRPTGIADIAYLSVLENRIRQLTDKRSREAVLVQAQVVYMGFVLDKLRVKRGLALADFPEVQHYPNTEKSERVGASICAAVNMLAGKMLPKYQEDRWVQYFWKRSLDFRPLNFSHLEAR